MEFLPAVMNAFGSHWSCFKPEDPPKGRLAALQLQDSGLRSFLYVSLHHCSDCYCWAQAYRFLDLPNVILCVQSIQGSLNSLIKKIHLVDIFSTDSYCRSLILILQTCGVLGLTCTSTDLCRAKKDTVRDC